MFLKFLLLTFLRPFASRRPRKLNQRNYPTFGLAAVARKGSLKKGFAGIH